LVRRRARPGLGLIKPFDGKSASVGNGTMVALACDSLEKVKAIYDKALKLGGKDEGPPGVRWATSTWPTSAIPKEQAQRVLHAG